MYESSNWKLSGCASNLLAHEDLGRFEEAHHRNIQAKFYNVKFPLVYESESIGDSLYEEHGATLKHKCGKRIVTLRLLSFSLIFLFFIILFFLFWWASLASLFYLGFFGLFYFSQSPESHPDLWGNHSLHHPFLTGAML